MYACMYTSVCMHVCICVLRNDKLVAIVKFFYFNLISFRTLLKSLIENLTVIDLSFILKIKIETYTKHEQITCK